MFGILKYQKKKKLPIQVFYRYLGTKVFTKKPVENITLEMKYFY